MLFNNHFVLSIDGILVTENEEPQFIIGLDVISMWGNPHVPLTKTSAD